MHFSLSWCWSRMNLFLIRYGVWYLCRKADKSVPVLIYVAMKRYNNSK